MTADFPTIATIVHVPRRVGSRRRVATVAGLTVALVTLLAPALLAAPRTQGIDVSHWQGDIDWTRVARTNVGFVVAKATDGKAFVDPQYLANRGGATGQEIPFTAYHYARPNRADDDARIEADHFVDTAGLGSGNLLPALDLEESNGLNPDELRQWTWRWLQRVTARTGVRPMIYSGPYFWRTAMGDTRFFANRGYEVLWVAHWFTPSPDVPAGNWRGHGWTFWQWTNCRSVAGISGCVDGDRFHGLDLTRVTIPRLRVETSAGGRIVSDPSGIRCGSSCEAVFHPGTSVVLNAEPDPGAVFLGWSGACAAAGKTPTCSVTTLGNKKATAEFGYPLTVTTPGSGSGIVRSTPAGVACGATCDAAFPTGTVVTLRADPDDLSEFAGWAGDCGGSSTCVLTMNAPHKVSAGFADLAPPQVVFAAPTTLGGPVVATFSEPVHGIGPDNLRLRVQGTSRLVRSSLTCRAADGRRVPCDDGPVITARIHPTSPLMIGQRYAATANPSGASRKIRDRVGKAAPRTISRFRAATSIGQAGPGVETRWARVASPRALGGSYLIEGGRGATASFRFSGRSITWLTVAGPGMGRARVSIDGGFRGTFDQYASRLRTDVRRTFSGLTAGSHVVRITVTGTKRGASAGAGIAIDAFDVQRLRVNPDPSMTWAAARSAAASAGSFIHSDRSGASAGLTFRGTGISWTAVLGPDRGRAKVFVDGALVTVEDLYAPARTFGVQMTVGGLSDGVHTVRVVVAGTRRSASTGTIVALDGWSAT